jgi:2-keto-4-pentenoate hydratase
VTPAFETALHRQHERLRAALAAGTPRLGWKICVNERRARERLGLEAPFVGFLDGARRLASGCVSPVPGTGAVEPEIALRLREAVAAGGSLAEARAAIGCLAPALEIVDYSRASLSLEGVVESSSFHWGFVLGEPRQGSRAPAIGADCPRVWKGGARAAAPDASLVPADLAEVVRLVADFLPRCGERLEAGDWILSGACTSPVRVEAGDEVSADFGELGSVSVRFAARGEEPPWR